MRPRISIVIPVYNHETALARAFASVVQQTYRPVEMIVVDDGSDEEIKTLGNGEIPVQLFRQNHAGAPAARNRGLREAKGEYVIFWDADVIAKPNMLETMAQALDACPGAGYAYSNFYFGKKKMPARTFDGEALRKVNYIHSTSLIRREAVILWDESLKRFQDWDMWLTMLEQGKKGIWIPEYLFHAIPRRNGMSAWLPRVAYQNPWRLLPGIRGIVQKYEAAKRVIENKHHI